MKHVTCDRCGSNRHALSGTEVILRSGETTSTEVLDLCRKCTSQFRTFLEGKPADQSVCNITVNSSQPLTDEQQSDLRQHLSGGLRR